LQREEREAGRHLGNALKEQIAPIVADVQSEALRLPARGKKHTGIRGRLAAGVKAEANGQHVRIVATMANPQEAGLPRGFDNGPRGFRHPVYGNRNVWVQQRGGSWFREPIAHHHDEVERDLTNVLEEMAHRIAAAGAIK
jgi:hypothetical protein